MKKFMLLLLVVLSNTVRGTELESTLSVASKIVTETPDVKIYYPHSYSQNKQQRYPVLYLLDGELNGVLVDSMLKHMSAANGAYEHIIVGIESSNRLRDFAPTVNRDPRGPVGEGGNGDKFLDFIEKELIPVINNRFRTNGHNVFAGHSVAGLLVIHSFQSRPHLFQAHLAFSPAVWWGEAKTAKETKKYILSNKGIENYLYLNIGNESGL